MRILQRMALVLPLLLASCDGVPAVPGTAGAVLPVTALPGWSRERVADAIPPLLNACPRLSSEWRAACTEARYVSAGDEVAARGFVQRNFRAVPLGQGLFTGYFELEVAGSRHQGGPYQVPVLRPPEDPRRYDRGRILGGALAGRGLEVVWLTSAADLYFLQLQGSGRVRLAEGGSLRLGYAVSNGHAPVATEALFRDAGIPGNDLSIPGLRAWIAARPGREARLNADPSYVYMRETGSPPGQGHTGALGTPLVPLRSVAVDPSYVPLGSPVWLDTVDSYSGRALQRLMLASDTGDQIRGQARTDIYYGWDHQAEAQGGHMYATGRAWVLRPVAEQRFAGLP